MIPETETQSKYRRIMEGLEVPDFGLMNMVNTLTSTFPAYTHDDILNMEAGEAYFIYYQLLWSNYTESAITDKLKQEQKEK